MNLGDLFDDETAKGTKEAVKGGFKEHIDPGEYVVSIYDIKMADKEGRAYAVIEFKVQGGEFDGRKFSKFYWMDEAQKRAFFYADLMRISEWDGSKETMPDADNVLGNLVNAVAKENKGYTNWYFNGLKSQGQGSGFDPSDEILF